MSAQEQVKAAQLEAAHALSRLLMQQGILHAFIGGFGIRLLGATRPTEDIDAIIDVGDTQEIVDRIRPFLQKQDARFSVEGLKLYFTSEANQQVRVSVETLAAGTLGLPPHITTFSPKNQGLPVLQPSILVLTKIKRWAMLSESTRPRSITKAEKDLEDIGYLLSWLAQHKENIDFAGYESTHPERLFNAVRQLVHIGKRDSWADLLELLVSVLTEEDLAKVKDA